MRAPPTARRSGEMAIKTHAELARALQETLEEKLYEQQRPQIELEERRARAREATSRRTWIVVRVFVVLSASGLLTQQHLGPFLGHLFKFVGSLLPLLPVGLIVAAVYLRRALVRLNREEVR
jgi:hypothetical protein